jgi:hypothetical protein
VSYYTPRAVLVVALVPGAFLVFVQYLETKFVLYRYITNYFKKIIKRKEVISYNWELTELME